MRNVFQILENYASIDCLYQNNHDWYWYFNRSVLDNWSWMLQANTSLIKKMLYMECFCILSSLFKDNKRLYWCQLRYYWPCLTVNRHYGKQCLPRWNATACGISSKSARFATTKAIPRGRKQWYLDILTIETMSDRAFRKILNQKGWPWLKSRMSDIKLEEPKFNPHMVSCTYVESFNSGIKIILLPN